MAAENQFRIALERQNSIVLKALISVAASRAARGDMKAMNLLLDRACGKPTADVHVDTGPSLRELILGNTADDE